MASRQPSLHRTCLALATTMLLAGAGQASAQTGKHAWTFANVSSGLHSVDHAVTVTYQPVKKLPRGALITQVYATRDYTGQADVQTSLCWGGTQHCVDIIGRSISTRAFNGKNAAQPLYLVHRLRARRDSPSPLHVKGNVTVWYATPPQPQDTPQR
ncbi:MAG: flagellar protein FlhE [Alcaligenaceae bacterium]|nr:flagellar protein FlhE [Alcaligenaceae bacterium]